jgi:hypothetical protein
VAAVLGYIKDYSCMLTTARKDEYYDKWSSMSGLQKGCLSDFLATNSTDALTFSKTCDMLGGDIISSVQLLQAYSKLGFAQEVTMSTQVQYMDPNTQTLQTQQQVLRYYYRLQIGMGCIEEFESRAKRGQDAWDNGAYQGLCISAVLLMVVGFFIYYRSRTVIG